MAITARTGDPSISNARRLDSWKEIASYLGRDLRTVQRWEKREGLPIHRHMHDRKGSVFAYAHELDEWRKNRVNLEPGKDCALPAPAIGPRLSAKTAATLAGAILALLASFGFLLRRIPDPPTTARAINRLLAAVKRDGGYAVPLPSLTGPAAISKDGRLMYISFRLTGSIAIVDLIGRKLLHQIPVGGQPDSLVLSKAGTSLFVGDTSDGLRIIDLGSGNIRSVATGGPVHGLQLSPDGKRLYLAMAYQGLKRLEISDEQVYSIPAVVCPVRLAANTHANQLWVSCRCGGPGGRPGHDYMDVLDFSSERSVKAVGGPPIVGSNIAVSPDGALVATDGADACTSTRYDHEGCPSVPSGVFHVFRTSDGQRLASIATTGQGALSFTPDGRRLTHVNGQRISVFETIAFRLTESVPDHARNLYVSPVRPEIYILSHSPDELRFAELLPAKCGSALQNDVFHLPADGVFTDLAGAGHAIPSRVNFQQGILGQAFHFDGTSSLEMPHDGEYGFHFIPNRSYMLWMRPHRTGTEEVVAERVYRDGSMRWRLIRRADARIRLEIVSPGVGIQGLDSNDVTPEGQWSSVAIVTTESEIRLMLNGVTQSDLTGRFVDPMGGRSRFGAGFGNQRSFVGLLDEIVARDGVFSESEMRAWDMHLRACGEPNR